MAGLLDALNSEQGLLGLSLLAAAAPKERRTTIGEGLLMASQNVQNMRNAQEERALKKRMIESQILENESQAAQRKAAAEKAAKMQEALAQLIGAQPQQSQYGVAGGGINLGGVQEPMRPRAGGLQGATLDQIATIKALGGPDLLEAWKVGQTGLEQKPGSFYTINGQRTYTPDPKEGINFDGQRISVIPGAAEARGELAGSVTGAQESAKAPFTMVPYTGPDGRPMTTTLDRLRDSLARSDAPQAPAGQGPTIDTVRADLAGGGAQFSSPAVERAVRQAAGMPMQSQGPGLRPQPGLPAGIPTGQSPQEQASMETIRLGNQAFMKDRYEPALSAGDAAGGILTSVQTARRALAGAVQGWGANQIAAGASFLGTIGVPQAERAATSAQMFEQSAMTRLWETLNSAKGPQTEGDADRASKTYARLQNTPRANAFILDLAEATATRDRMRAEYFRQALPLAQKSGDLQEIDRRWSRVAPSIWSMDIMKKWGAQ